MNAVGAPLQGLEANRPGSKLVTKAVPHRNAYIFTTDSSHSWEYKSTIFLTKIYASNTMEIGFHPKFQFLDRLFAAAPSWI